jgi:hypothetical protein
MLITASRILTGVHAFLELSGDRIAFSPALPHFAGARPRAAAVEVTSEGDCWTELASRVGIEVDIMTFFPLVSVCGRTHLRHHRRSHSSSKERAVTSSLVPCRLSDEVFETGREHSLEHKIQWPAT